MNTITSLYELKRHLGIADDATADHDRLWAAMRAATAQLERLTGRRYVPWWGTREQPTLPPAAQDVLLAEALLELHAVRDDTGDIPTDDVTRIPYYGPTVALRRNVGTYSGTLAVDGLWGWHSSPADAWQPTNDELQGSLPADLTTTFVVNASLTREDGAPIFQVGGLLRVDDEIMRVLSVDTAFNALVLVRGVCGTSITAHESSTPLDYYRYPPEVVAAALRLAAWHFRAPDQGARRLPDDVIDAVSGLQRVVVGG